MIPGVVLGVLVGAWRFGLDLQVSPLVVPAVLMVALTATCVGYAIASVLPYMLTVIITQAIVVFVFMFSPLTFLPDKLPGWLEAIHRILPIQAMGEVTRGTLAPNEFGLPLGRLPDAGGVVRPRVRRDLRGHDAAGLGAPAAARSDAARRARLRA